MQTPKNLNFGFIRQEIQCFSADVFVLGAEGKGGPPPLPRRKDKNIPENIEYPTDKSEVQVKTDLVLLAGEASGDHRGAQLIEQLLTLQPSLQIAAVAGPQMRKFPIHCIAPMEKLQVMGFVDVALALPHLASLFFSLRKQILTLAPRALIGIDYADFNLRMHESLRHRGFQGRLIQYISPTVWAWRKKRAQKMSRTLDLLLSILPFEPAHFASTPLPVKYVGHPLVESLASFQSRPDWRLLYGLKPRDKILALFPGSRREEIEKNLPLMVGAALQLQKQDPFLRIGVSLSHPEKEGIIRPHLPPGAFLVGPEETYQLMHHAHLALAKSGTVALELALHQIPTVVQFAIGSFDLFLARRVFGIDLPYYSLPNLLLQKEVFPELFGPHLTPSALIGHAERLWFDPAARRDSQERCRQVILTLGKSGASETAARHILESI